MGFLDRLFGKDDAPPAQAAAPAPGSAAVDRHRLHTMLGRGGQTISLRQLRSYGLHAVRVIDAQTIHQVARQAVEHVLRERPAGAPALTGEEVAEVEKAVGARVLELMQQNQQLTAERQELVTRSQTVERRRAELEAQMTALRDELAQRQAELAEERKKSPRVIVTIDDASFDELERRVARVFERLARDGELTGPDGAVRLATVERELRELLTRVVAEVKAKHTGAEDAKVEELELRIEKLNQALAQREEAIRKLAVMKGFDPGIASIFDSIQGLDPSALDFDRKAELLKEVFLQNLELQGLEATRTDVEVFPIQQVPRIATDDAGISPAVSGESAF